VLPYAIDTYICTCTHKEFIIQLDNQEIQKYSCTICENDRLVWEVYIGEKRWGRF